MGEIYSSIAKQHDGRWVVLAGKRVLAGPFETNAEAWRAVDRMMGDPTNKSEERADWFWNNRMHGGL